MTRTVLQDRQIERALAAFDVGRPVASRRLDAGTINSNYRVDVSGDGGAATFFLRVNEGKTEADVVYEVDLVTALAGAGVPTPTPRRTIDGDGFARIDGLLVSLFPWIEGSHRDADAVTAADTRRLGRALAALHRASAPMLERFDRAGIYTTSDIANRYASFRDSADPALATRALGLIGEELAALEVASDARGALPAAVIHGDLFRDNVLWDGGELVALIDFEQASRGTPLYDVAVCINAWCFRDGTFDDALVSALLAGYRAERPLPECQPEALHTECRAAAVRFAVTRITDIHLAGLARTGKSFEEYLDRIERLRDWLSPLEALIEALADA